MYEGMTCLERVAYHSKRGGVYLDTCFSQRLMDFTIEHPHVLPLILFVLVLIMLASLVAERVIALRLEKQE